MSVTSCRQYLTGGWFRPSPLPGRVCPDTPCDDSLWFADAGKQCSTICRCFKPEAPPPGYNADGTPEMTEPQIPADILAARSQESGLVQPNKAVWWLLSGLGLLAGVVIYHKWVKR